MSKIITFTNRRGETMSGSREDIKNMDLRYAQFGYKAALEHFDFSGLDLSNSEFGESASLRWANFRDANLSWARLPYCDLRSASFSRTKFIDANLCKADLSGCEASDADFTSAMMTHAKFCSSHARDAIFSRASLSYADFGEAHLKGCDFTDALLKDVKFGNANLSGAKGIPSASDFMRIFARDDHGFLVFKRIGAGKTEYAPPKQWVFEPGSFLEEVACEDRGEGCGCGVNFGTASFVDLNYQSAEAWICRIRWEDAAGIVVPYSSRGKARCSRLELVRKIDASELSREVDAEYQRRKEQYQCANHS